MADKIKHPKKKRRPVKKPPALFFGDYTVTEEEAKIWALNAWRRNAIILRKTAVKTAATRDEIVNLCKKDAFIIAACKALGWVDQNAPEFCKREGYEHLFEPPQKKAGDMKIWDEKNTPPRNPLNKEHSIFVYVRNEALAEYIAYFDFEDEIWKNRENKRCNNICDWSMNPTKKNQE